MCRSLRAVRAGLFTSGESLQLFVKELSDKHPTFQAVRFWRVLVTALVQHFDDYLEGDVRPTGQLYDDIMDRLRED